MTGVTFDSSHSSKDWGLHLKEVKVEFPEIKREQIEVPGMNGKLDLTDAQNGGVKYSNRVLEFVFDLRDCTYQKWSNMVSMIATELHGQVKKIIIDTDPGFYYSGVCKVETTKRNDVIAEIAIKCDCDPFKIDVFALNNKWVWDSMNFTDGVARKIAEVTVSNPSEWKPLIIYGWEHNEPPHIVVDAAMQVQFDEVTYNLTIGENVMHEIELKKGRNELNFKGTGNAKILQIGGML